MNANEIHVNAKGIHVTSNEVRVNVKGASRGREDRSRERVLG
ncbi:Hypothetical protein CAP_0240 [Chondromyces apiculatus DSM 436]|uniref:Uncharacterized protein n=1 Tax=Chondromyces apiculatus DSM 436 TaxID=1192034 RepID=A0A017TF06_9BACT|nr:Hypothetical protein CAP_0240 [Chondromyces apiculatus DSM 436]